jgi:WD40 repeat protein
MFQTICSLPLSAELFAQDIHPTESVLAVGLSTGHVQCLRIPNFEDSDKQNGVNGTHRNGGRSSTSSDGCAEITTSWRTRRHKGSCRTLGFSLDGTTLYSSGTDGIIKAASAETGRVSSKALVPANRYVLSNSTMLFRDFEMLTPMQSETNESDFPSLLQPLTPQTLLLGTDSGALHLFDLRADATFASARPAKTYFPHDEYVSSITLLPPSDASTSGYSKAWVSTGGSTLSVTDVRKGVLKRSEDQEEELLSSTYVRGFAKKGTSVGEKVVVGDGAGVLTLWERGVWDDQDERIVLSRQLNDQGVNSVNCVVAIPSEIAGNGKMLAAGLENGSIATVQLGPNKVLGALRHHDTDGVAHVNFDVEGRMISGGGNVVKLWHPLSEEDTNGIDQEFEDAGEMQGKAANGAKRYHDDEDDDADGDEESSEEEKPAKKRKKGKGKRKGGGGRPQLGAFSGLD